MKQLLYLFVVLFTLVGLTSCGSDDLENNPLVGTWVEEKQYGEWLEYKFNKDMTGYSYCHYTDSNGNHYDGSEIECIFTYEFDLEKKGFRVNPISETAYRYRGGKLYETGDRSDRMASWECEFEIQHKYEGEYILVLTSVDRKGYTDTITLYKK